MDGEKFNSIYDKYKNLVTSTACYVLKDYHLAQDVCQEVFMKITEENLIRLEHSPNEMRRYLRTVAEHRAIDYYRKIRRRSETSLYEDENIPMEFDLEERLDQDRFTSELFAALKKKNPEWYYIVIHLGLYDEKPEIVARDMNISLSLLRSKYHRAKKWLCKEYGLQYHYFK